jgi:hypothetical protein
MEHPTSLEQCIILLKQTNFGAMPSLQLVTEVLHPIDFFLEKKKILFYKVFMNPCDLIEPVKDTSDELEIGELYLEQFDILPQDQTERRSLAKFMGQYYLGLSDETPFVDLQAFHAFMKVPRTVLQSAEGSFDPPLGVFIAYGSFGLLVHAVEKLAYSAYTPFVEVALDEIRQTGRLLKGYMRTIHENNITEHLKSYVNAIRSDDCRTFPHKLYHAFCAEFGEETAQDSTQTTVLSNDRLEELLANRLKEHSRQILYRDSFLMKYIYQRRTDIDEIARLKAEIRSHFGGQAVKDIESGAYVLDRRIWCLIRDIPACDGRRGSKTCEMYILFRGTSNVSDALTDLNCWPGKKFGDFSRVHRGFYLTFQRHWRLIQSLIALKSKDVDPAHWHFILSGHSLGASWARLAALKITEEYRPRYKIQLTLAAYPGIFLRGFTKADDVKTNMLIRNYNIESDFFVRLGSVAMVQDLPRVVVTEPLKWFTRCGVIKEHYITSIRDAIKEHRPVRIKPAQAVHPKYKSMSLKDSVQDKKAEVKEPIHLSSTRSLIS